MLVVLLIEDSPYDIVYSLEGILSPGRARNKIVLFDQVEAKYRSMA